MVVQADDTPVEEPVQLDEARRYAFARGSAPSIVLALALILNACLPGPPSPAEFRTTAAEPAETWIGGSGPIHSLLALPPLPFEQVTGGTDGPVSYRARAGALTAQYGPASVSYAVVGHEPAEVDADPAADCPSIVEPARSPCVSSSPARLWRLSQELVGARSTEPVALEQAETVVSAFVSPASAWQSGLPTYHRLAYQDAWPGVDLVYERAGPRGLKSTYHLAAGADPGTIRLLWRGAEVRLSEDGALVLATPLGELRESAPVAWQEVAGQRQPVPARFAIVSQLPGDAATTETEVGFVLGAYDPGRPLVIDPTLLYASYIGGGERDQGIGVVVDASRAIYVSGYTASTHSTFPNGNGLAPLGVPGFDQTYNGGNGDAFVMKLSPGGTSVAYAAYLGGVGDEGVPALAVDASGAAYVAGVTTSTEATFPIGAGAGAPNVPGFDRTYNGGSSDVFVVKLAPSGTSIVYSTYLGGNGSDFNPNIAVDAGGAAYVTGATSSAQATFPNGQGFASLNPAVPGFDQTYNGGEYDAFMVKLAPNGQSLAYATFLGGGYGDIADAMALGGDGALYVVGHTDSREETFPNGTGLAGLGIPGFDQTYNGGDLDGFVVKLSPNGRSLGYATFLGGDARDEAVRVAVDASGAAYVSGYALSSEWTFPDGDPNNNDQIDAPGFDRTHNGGFDAYLVKLSPTGASLAFATFLGGNGNDVGSGVSVGADGAVYLVGLTSSTQSTFPNGAGLPSLDLPGFDQTYNGGDYDGFVVKLAPSGTGLLYATYFGGDGTEVPYALATDPDGVVRIVGSTASNEGTFPDGDPNANDRIDVPGFDRGANGGDDVFVVKVGPPATSTPTPSPTSTPLPTNTPPSTPTPTSTASPTPTPIATALPGRCAPRPNVLVTTAPTGDGRLRATIRAHSLPATPSNALSSLRVNGLANARVSLGDTVLSQGQSVPLAQGTQEAVLTVERVTAGQAATVQLVVTDACGAWPTLVGGGPGAF